MSGDCRCCRVGEQGSRLTVWVEPRSTWRMCAEGCLGGEAEWVARGGVEVLRSVITMIGPWIDDMRRCHVEV